MSLKSANRKIPNNPTKPKPPTPNTKENQHAKGTIKQRTILMFTGCLFVGFGFLFISVLCLALGLCWISVTVCVWVLAISVICLAVWLLGFPWIFGFGFVSVFLVFGLFAFCRFGFALLFLFQFVLWSLASPGKRRGL